MPVLQLTTIINAPIEVCFNLARSIDAHQHSTNQTHEKAIAGKTSGLIEEGETVTWEAKHFGIKQQLTVKITEMEFPNYFKDKMVKGAFKSMQHIHTFEKKDEYITLMKDKFTYTSPLGILGAFFDVLVLKSYMRNFLIKRNAVLKHIAESGKWKRYF